MDGLWRDTLIPWSQGKQTIILGCRSFRLAMSHLQYSVIKACVAADATSGNKVLKYAHLATTYTSVRSAVETGGSSKVEAVGFIQVLRKQISYVTSEPLELEYLPI